MGEEAQGRTRQARDSGGAPMTEGVAKDLSELARDLEAETNTDALMDRIVRAAVKEIDGATGAAITLLEHGRVSSPAHSDDRARRVGLAQEDTRQGPCVDTSRDEITLRSDDLRTDTRWPKWAAAAVKEGVLSAMSLQLFVESQSMGALDFYADQPFAFNAEAENIALLLASHAAIAMSGNRKVQNLHAALQSRDIIGQAKGILMERYKIDAVQAFDLLIGASQATHRKLHVIADQLATTGEFPLPASRP
jgi:transcriptional regulator with GAF, ATPase, and Fis domain